MKGKYFSNMAKFVTTEKKNILGWRDYKVPTTTNKKLTRHILMAFLKTEIKEEILNYFDRKKTNYKKESEILRILNFLAEHWKLEDNGDILSK